MTHRGIVRRVFLVGCAILIAGVWSAHAQPADGVPADTVLLNGKIVQFDAPYVDALAVRDGRVVALGASADIARHVGPNTRTVDLGGRTVIPGLIDSHIHAIRAGLTYTGEVHWIGARSIPEALDRLRAAAKTAPPGSWLVVAGGWTERQFTEARRPTRAEIAQAAPDHHVYVQLLYTAVLVSEGGLEKLGIPNDTELASRLTVESGPDGKPSGWIAADNRTISELFDRLPRPDFDSQVAGTRAFFRTLNGLGITGVLDPGGYNLPLEAYRALFRVWREGGLTLRVAYSLCAPRRDHELEDFRALTAMLPMGFGDDWLRFNGIGENVTWGMYNNETPTDTQKERLYETLTWAAARGLTATFHWQNERSVHHLLEVLERVNRDTPVAPLRWSIAHLNDASPDSLGRMKQMGVGWLMQNAFYFRGEAFLGQRGADAMRLAPPIGSALRMGLNIGGGTDAHRVMSYNPFVSLQWMLDGKTVGGTPSRMADETPTRLEALRLYNPGQRLVRP
ncbi:MAG: TIM-barrel fold metal-dependent hydrolase [Xanthobacteraceae bacterium]|nr:TIM-barrel fold metal-dependent hydrolase [Xanthobacteraceae bacterium]